MAPARRTASFAGDAFVQVGPLLPVTVRYCGRYIESLVNEGGGFRGIDLEKRKKHKLKGPKNLMCKNTTKAAWLQVRRAPLYTSPPLSARDCP